VTSPQVGWQFFNARATTRKNLFPGFELTVIVQPWDTKFRHPVDAQTNFVPK
jgi:hypothetical protein